MVKPRVAWAGLDDDYRKRLENQGYTEAMHIAGVPKTNYRGHAHTPEHPSEAAKHPERYAGYNARHPHAALAMQAFIRQPDFDPSFSPSQHVDLASHVDWTTQHRSLIGRHWNAVKNWHYAQTRSEADAARRFRDLFAPFDEQTIGGNGRGKNKIPTYEFETRREVIDWYLSREEGEGYEDIYTSV